MAMVSGTRAMGFPPSAGGVSASVAQPVEQAAGRERYPQALLEESVDEGEAGQAQGDADCPAFTGPELEVEERRGQRGDGEAEEPDRPGHRQDPPADLGGPARRRR